MIHKKIKEFAARNLARVNFEEAPEVRQRA